MICPLAFEAGHVRRRLGRTGRARASVVVSGPGPARARACVEALEPAPSLVILAGVAGGIEPGAEPEAGAMTPGVVIGPDELAIRSAHPIAEPSRSLASVATPVRTPAAKRTLHEKTGASIVDTEAYAFCEAAVARGIPWLVVRAVSDGPGDTLPDWVDRLVDESGKTNPLGVAGALVRGPARLGVLLRLGKYSGRAMGHVGRRVASIIAELPDPLPSPLRVEAEPAGVRS